MGVLEPLGLGPSHEPGIATKARNHETVRLDSFRVFVFSWPIPGSHRAPYERLLDITPEIREHVRHRTLGTEYEDGQRVDPHVSDDGVGRVLPQRRPGASRRRARVCRRRRVCLVSPDDPRHVEERAAQQDAAARHDGKRRRRFLERQRHAARHSLPDARGRSVS